MTTDLKVGGETFAWCTKCKLVLHHRVVAMLGAKPVKVECKTCKSTHNYKADAPGTKAVKAANAGKAPKRTAASATRAAAAARGEASKHARLDAWEKTVAGQDARSFTAYKITGQFAAGELVKHNKFGDGYVVRIVDASKIEVSFRDENRTLAQGWVQ